jgi:arabinofuranan 3-O-arabinosyltransferase
MTILSRGLVLLRKLVFHRLLYYVLAWLLALGSAGVALYTGWIAFNTDQRPDGNLGHTTIDFGGQYLMGRMLVTGNGRDLYNRGVQRTVLQVAYPDTVKDAREANTDSENLMSWVMGQDDSDVPTAFGVVLTPLAATDPLSLIALELARQSESRWTDEQVARKGGKRQVGGPLYPPINAFIYAPLALLQPQAAYRVNQVLNVVLLFLAGLGVSVITRRGVWWPMAAFTMLIFPGAAGSLNLGQNAAHTLTIIVWGWALASRGRPGWGGVVWGLLAFKPVWALALFLVPLLSRRWRMCGMMIATGAGLAVATLPFVGWHTWLEWLHVGKLAAQVYNTDENWIFLSRDLLGIPRRWMLNFASGAIREPTWYPPPREGMGVIWHALFGDKSMPPWLLPSVVGWVLVAFVLEVTLRTALLRRRQARATVGPPAAFLFLGAWLVCYHFMYYDVLLAVLPVLLLWHDPGEFLRPIYLVLWVERGKLAGDDLGGYHGPRLMWDLPPPPPPLPVSYRHIWLLNRVVPNLTVLVIATQAVFPLLGLGTFFGPPWDTFCLMALWLWCFITWMRLPDK